MSARLDLGPTALPVSLPRSDASADAPVDAPADTARGRLITLRGAAVRYGDVQALAPLDLTLYRGERVALVGANGSGKTTLLRRLHGLVDGPGERQVFPMAGTAAHAPAMAMLFQRPYLLHLSVRRNLTLALWLAGVPRRDRRVRAEAALERVGLLALADRPARALSGGQQQRLALARAWALQPEVLFLDEPTASLDPSAKREVEALIEAFAHDGLTLVMSTHNLGQAKRLADRVLYLEGGHLRVDLPAARFFDDREPHAATAFLKGELPWT